MCGKVLSEILCLDALKAILRITLLRAQKTAEESECKLYTYTLSGCGMDPTVERFSGDEGRRLRESALVRREDSWIEVNGFSRWQCERELTSPC